VRLESISVQKYRSIRTAQKLRLGSLTVLIGPNNEGKSNLLRAMVAGMTALSQHGRVRHAVMRRSPARRFGGEFRRDYVWERDFPVDLQEKQPNGNTLIDFEFELDGVELGDFKSEFGSSLNGFLPIRVSMGNKGAPDFTVRKQRVGQVLSDQSPGIARFVGERLRVEYVPSIRTAQAAMDVIDAMVAEELGTVEGMQDYRKAVETIESLQSPVLRNLSNVIRDMLGDFLPEVADVDVEISEEDRYLALRRSSRVIIDDGTATDLFLKGDGVQSLAAISLIRHAALAGPKGPELILCIEEPEAHLHPKAIHRLRAVLHEIASRQQVVLTTHSPLLANRSRVDGNIIVENSNAKPARSIVEIRETLGVRTSDNLKSAELALVVEGESDKVSLRALIEEVSSSEFDSGMESGLFAIETLAGGGNLTYRLSSLQEAMCRYHVFLDNDDAGRSAASRAQVEGLLEPLNQTFATAPGMTESEFEDLLDPELYKGMIRARYNVDLDTKSFRNSKQKWSMRMSRVFAEQGQLWTEGVERQVKTDVALLVASDPTNALHHSRKSAFDALVTALEAKVKGMA